MPRHSSKLFHHRYFPALKKPASGRIYLFLGFGGTIPAYSPAILRLCRNGFSVIAFRFSARKIMALRIKTLATGIDDICKTVEAYESKRRDNLQTIAFGNSMGSVFAWQTAQRVKSIDKVVANTGYALISKMTFEWTRNKTWLKELTEEGYTEATFHEAILDLEPITHFDKLKGKRVLLFMNRDDNVINFEHAKLFKDALEHNHINYVYIENKDTSHAGAIIKNIFSKRLISFLLDEG